MSESVSVRDVAAAAGVSIASVSRVLNNVGYASTDVRARVERAVKAIGYLPNFNARHLRTGRSHAIGFLVSNLANPFLSEVFASIELRMQAAGFSLLVASTHNRPSKERELLALFENRRLEGVIAAPCEEGQPNGANAFARCNLPLVIFDRDINYGADVVRQDHAGGVGKAVAYLVSLGHRRIALFGPSVSLRPGRDKLQGYREALLEANLAYDPGLVCMFESAVDSSESQMSEMLASKKTPTALIALGTRILSGALRATRNAGLGIPDDLSVIGIGTESAFALMHPPLTMLKFDIEQLATATSQLMLERLANRSALPRTLTVGMDLVLGASCSPRPTRRFAATRHGRSRPT